MHKQTHTVLRKARKNGVKGADQRGETKSASGESGESEGKEERNSGSEAADVDSGEGSSAPASTESAGGTRKGKAKTLDDDDDVDEQKLDEEYSYRESQRWCIIGGLVEEHRVDTLQESARKSLRDFGVVGRGRTVRPRVAAKKKEVDGEITKGFKRGPGTVLTFTDSSTSPETTAEENSTTTATDVGDVRQVFQNKSTTFAKPNPKTTGKKGKL